MLSNMPLCTRQNPPRCKPTAPSHARVPWPRTGRVSCIPGVLGRVLRCLRDLSSGICTAEDGCSMNNTGTLFKEEKKAYLDSSFLYFMETL